MFDDLRQSGSFLDDEENTPGNGSEPSIPGSNPPREGKKKSGFSPMLQFIAALLVLFMVCALGGVCLILTERITLPFF